MEIFGMQVSEAWVKAGFIGGLVLLAILIMRFIFKKDLITALTSIFTPATKISGTTGPR